MHEILTRLRFRRDHRWAPDRMSEYLDRELADGGRERMERHVSECPECRRLLTGLGLVVEALHALSAPEGGRGAVQIAATVRAQISERP
jgi:anti-sigma factor RsiW